MTPTARRVLFIVLRVLAAVGLFYDAKVHLHLAKNYDAVGSTITQGALFRVEGVTAIIVGLALLVFDHRLTWAAAGLVGLSGVGAVLLYRYVNVPAIGPIPRMYEPSWYPEKTHSALAEGAVVLLWLIREGLRLGRRRVATAK